MMPKLSTYLLGCPFALCLATVSMALPIGFDAPEVVKLDWGTRALNVKDINGDGLEDVALINNDRTQIQLLLRQAEVRDEAQSKLNISANRWSPVVEDPVFEKTEITIGFPLFDLVIGDFNADGFEDIAYTGGVVPLSIRYQNQHGRWSEPEEYEGFDSLGWPNTLKAKDLDGDGTVELVALGKDALRVRGQTDLGYELEAYFITGDNPFNLMLEDVNRDGHRDILYLTSGASQTLALRLQLDDGGFGPEIRFPFERPVRIITPLPGNVGEAVTFCAVDARSGGLEFFQLERMSEEASRTLRPEAYPIFKKGRSTPSYSLVRWNGLGEQDVLITNPESAELYWLAAEGALAYGTPKRYPTLTDVTSQSIGRFFVDAEPMIVSLSPSESMIGLSAVSANGRITFPQPLNLGEGSPLVCAVVDWDGDGYDEVAVCYETSQGVLGFALYQPNDRAQIDSQWEKIAEIDTLGPMRRAPDSMQVLRAFPDGGSGVMIFTERQAPVILKLDPEAENKITEFGSNSSIRQGFLKGLSASQLSESDLDGDGVSELIVGRTGYARALSIEGADFKMVDQFNTRRSDDVVSAILPEVLLQGVHYLGLYVGSTGELQLLAPESDGVYRYNRTEMIGPIDLVASPISIGAGDTDHRGYLLPGGDQFWVLRFDDTPVWSRKAGAVYETELEDVHYTDALAADFNADGKLEMVALDGQSHVVEILSEDDAEGWKRLMYWEVFEQNMHYQGRTGAKLEPREVAIGELTGDIRSEFILLVHDRMLIYPQK